MTVPTAVQCTVPLYTAERGTLIMTGRCGRTATHTMPSTPVNCCDRHTALFDGIAALQPLTSTSGTPR